MKRRAALVLGLVCSVLAFFFWNGGEKPAASLAENPPSPASQGADQVGSMPARAPEQATPDASNAAQIAFEGDVISANDDSGVEGAELIFSVGGRYVRERANIDGHFELHRRDSQWQLIAITADNFEPFIAAADGAPWTEAADGSRLSLGKFALEPSDMPPGRVVDQETKIPVAGARVSLAFNANGLESALAEQLTDKQGDFILHPFPGDVVRVEYPGYEAVLFKSIGHPNVLDLNDGRRAVIELRRKGAQFVIEGRVLNKWDAGVGGASVSSATHALLDREWLLGPTRLWSVTDTDGNFRLDVKERGEHHVTAYGAGGSTAKATVAVEFRATERVLLRLTDHPGAITGRVTGTDGTPLTSFVVGLVENLDQIDPTLPFEANSGRSDRLVPTLSANGTFRVATRTGTYGLRISARGYAATGLRSVRVSEGEVVTSNFTLDRGLTVTGMVVDRETRAPIAGVLLSVQQVDDAAAPTHSAADGTFELNGVQPGLRELDAYAGRLGFIRRSIPLGAPGVPMVVDLARTDGERSGEFEGMGAVLGTCDGGFELRSLMAGGGALSAGLQEGDCILGVDNLKTDGMTMQEMLSRGRGPQGTLVHLGLRRGTRTFEVNVVRRRLRTP
jgi:hypothetical protein